MHDRVSDMTLHISSGTPRSWHEINGATHCARMEEGSREDFIDEELGVTSSLSLEKTTAKMSDDHNIVVV
ncbi:hypothetical protein EPI10_022884 [Gossypium australe]|uniref:Uncharacterized protein n=1 Tax=Gossypium australe TaxID=47621 RepID=A0A5B6VTC3_9ROSI|nr:hypothetical protein EPI10_022884 [Gossypium australe]